MTTVQHSAKSVEWGTPGHVVDLVRAFGRGTISLDPFSSPEFNERVGALRYLTDGLSQPWPAAHLVLVNPPGNSPHEENFPARAWRKLLDERDSFVHAIWIAFTLEHLRHCQDERGSLCQFTACYPRKRLAFERPDGTPGKSPGHANAIVYIPGARNGDPLASTYRFRMLFSHLGAVSCSY